VPYKNLSNLPKSVREHLPKHAQEIYRAAYNSAWDEYAQDEERAHKVAWSAVKKKYEKDGSNRQWKTRDNEQDKQSSS
jgi:cation transport regulator